MKKPSRDQLKRDIDNGLSWDVMATKYGYASTRFLRKLRVRYGLPPLRTYLKPSREDLARMIGKGMTPYEIADKLGYKDGGWSNIYKHCRDYGIEFDFRPNKHLYDRPFSAKQQSLIWGTLLGDGTLTATCNGNNVVYRVTQGYKQRAYLEWKYALLAPYVLTPPKKREGINPVGNLSTTYSFGTITHPWLVSVYPLCYPNYTKTVSLKWLNNVDDFALAVWFMDDGSLNIRHGAMTFCTNSFDYQQHLIIKNWFADRWNIDAKIEPRRNNTFNLRVNPSVADKLKDIISPHVPSFMRYKVASLK